MTEQSLAPTTARACAHRTRERINNSGFYGIESICHDCGTVFIDDGRASVSLHGGEHDEGLRAAAVHVSAGVGRPHPHRTETSHAHFV